MSLRTRLLAALLAVNLGVLVAVQLASARNQEQRLRAYLARTPLLLSEGILRYAYAPEPGRTAATERVRRILSTEVSLMREYFDDVWITNELPGADFRGAVQLNPMGAMQRGGEPLPLDRIRAGISEAVRTGQRVSAAGGICVGIRSGDEVVAGAWVRPRLDQTPAPLPFAAYALPVLFATLALGVFSYFLIGNGVLRPLRRLGNAAARVAAGDASTVRVERLSGAAELNEFVDAFNEMAERVAHHAAVLEQEVARATEEVRRRERAMIASGRLAAVGTLAAGVAHEINNPIGGMQNAVRRLRERASAKSADERELVYLDLVAEGLERIARTTRRVLDFSPKNIEPRPFSLREAVDGARALVEHRLRRAAGGVRIVTELEADLPQLVGDRHEFQQVLLNLMINSLDAFEAAGRGGTIRITARAADEFVETLVEDDGPGMASELVARVFDPFFSAKNRPDASGLGMFVCHAILDNHGGSIEVDSDEGAGFRVWLRMPCAGSGSVG